MVDGSSILNLVRESICIADCSICTAIPQRLTVDIERGEKLPSAVEQLETRWTETRRRHHEGVTQAVLRCPSCGTCYQVDHFEDYEDAIVSGPTLRDSIARLGPTAAIQLLASKQLRADAARVRAGYRANVVGCESVVGKRRGVDPWIRANAVTVLVEHYLWRRFVRKLEAMLSCPHHEVVLLTAGRILSAAGHRPILWGLRDFTDRLGDGAGRFLARRGTAVVANLDRILRVAGVNTKLRCIELLSWCVSLDVDVSLAAPTLLGLLSEQKVGHRARILLSNPELDLSRAIPDLVGVAIGDGPSSGTGSTLLSGFLDARKTEALRVLAEIERRGCRQAASSVVNKCRRLLRSGPHHEYVTEKMKQTYVEAAERGDFEEVRAFLDRGVRVTDYRAAGRGHALPGAAANGHIAVVRLLLYRSKGLRIKDLQGEWALVQASRNGHLDVVRALLDHGVRPEPAESGGNAAVTHAAEQGQRAVVALLLERGASVDPTGPSPLALSAAHGHLGTVQTLLEQGAAVDGQDALGSSGLFLASAEGHAVVVRYLLDHGADVNRPGSWTTGRATPLIIAAKNGHVPVVRILLDRSPVLDARDFDGRDALFYARKVPPLRKMLEHAKRNDRDQPRKIDT